MAQSTIELPEFPIALVRGTEVYIVNEDGQESLWGHEIDVDSAYEVAEEIQMELRAIKYVKNRLSEFLDRIAEELLVFGIPLEHLDKVIYEGCFKVQKMLLELSS
ncbi:MAG: hypothetical protein PVH79_01210 [Candidatus Bathyarchaeota archaeon]